LSVILACVERNAISKTPVFLLDAAVIAKCLIFTILDVFAQSNNNELKDVLQYTKLYSDKARFSGLVVTDFHHWLSELS